jgi:hypothetical protein
MKHLLIGTALALWASTMAYAQNPAATSPEPNATAPTNQIEPAKPDMKAQTAREPAQTAAAKNPGFIPDQNWVGRYVYSSDNEDLGKVAEVNTNQVGFDMGGFLGIGATRKHVAANQIESVQSDRIILRMTEAEADKLPGDNK